MKMPIRFDWLSNIGLCECAAPKQKKTSLQLIVEINWNGVEAAAAAAVAAMVVKKTSRATEFDSIIEGKLSDKYIVSSDQFMRLTKVAILN